MMSKYQLQDDEILRAINDSFQLSIEALEYISVGEMSDTYVANSNDEQKYIVKIQDKPADDTASIIKFFQANSFKWLPKTHLSKDGNVWSRNGGYFFSVQQFIDSSEVLQADSTASNNILDEIAIALSDLHELNISASTSEKFRESRESEIVSELTEYIHQIRQLSNSEGLLKDMNDLVVDKSKIIDQLFENYNNSMPKSSGKTVLTHGDMHLGNVRNPTSDHIYLIDWDWAAVSVPERDFMYFTEEQLDAVLSSYRGEIDARSIKHYRAYLMLRAVWHTMASSINNPEQAKNHTNSLAGLLDDNQFLRNGLKS